MVVIEQLRQPYGFANQSFCPSDILIIQVKANCGVSEKLLVFDEEEVERWSVTLVEDKDEFLYCLIWKFLMFEKAFHKVAFLLMSHGNHGTSQDLGNHFVDKMFW